jgi:hypothetical protein
MSRKAIVIKILREFYDKPMPMCDCLKLADQIIEALSKTFKK